MTALLYTTVAVPGPVTFAVMTDGALSSWMSRDIVARSPSALGTVARSRTAFSAIARVPLARSGAAVPPNSTTCVSVSLPAKPVTGRATESPRFSAEYVPGGAATGSVYVMVRFWPPVMAERSIRGLWASARSCENAVSAPSALPDSSASTVWFRSIDPVALVAASGAANATAWSAVDGPVGSVTPRPPPGTRVKVPYAPGTLATGSLYVMVRVRPPVMAPPTIVGAWPSRRACWNAADAPSRLPDSSASAVWSMVRVPVALVAAAAPSNETAWVAEAAPDGPVTPRAPPGVRDRDAYPAGTRVTASLYVMVRALPPVTLADRTVGAWPSRRACWNAADAPSRLPDSSASAVWSMVRVPVALVAAAAPSNETAWVAEAAPDGPVTPRAPPGVRDRDAYPAGTRVTASLYVMVRALPPVTLADRTVGAWPSRRACWNAADAPSRLPDSSASAVWSMVRVPVALVAAAAPSNETAWVAEAAPDGPVTPRAPPGVRDRDAYPAGTRVTASLYVMVRALPPVTLADRTVGAWPSARACENDEDMPSRLPDSSASAVWSMVRVPVALVAAAAPSNETAWVAEAAPDGPVTPRAPPGVRDREAYRHAGNRVAVRSGRCRQ